MLFRSRNVLAGPVEEPSAPMLPARIILALDVGPAHRRQVAGGHQDAPTVDALPQVARLNADVRLAKGLYVCDYQRIPPGGADVRGQTVEQAREVLRNS